MEKEVGFSASLFSVPLYFIFGIYFVAPVPTVYVSPAKRTLMQSVSVLARGGEFGGHGRQGLRENIARLDKSTIN